MRLPNTDEMQCDGCGGSSQYPPQQGGWIVFYGLHSIYFEDPDGYVHHHTSYPPDWGLHFCSLECLTRYVLRAKGDTYHGYHDPDRSGGINSNEFHGGHSAHDAHCHMKWRDRERDEAQNEKPGTE